MKKRSYIFYYFMLLIIILKSSLQKNCGASCVECDISESREITCKRCNPGFKLSEGSCVACEVEGCASCTSNSVECIACKTGWFNSTTQVMVLVSNLCINVLLVLKAVKFVLMI